MLLAVVFVTVSLRRPPVEAYPPTPRGFHTTGDSLIGPLTFTIDASSADAWRYFAFARGGTVAPDDSVAWDLAFRRFHVMVNGGAGFSGGGGIASLGAVSFDSVLAAPAAGYVGSKAGRDSSNAAIARWYDYSWTSHLLEPKPHVWVVRTATGRYAKLRMISYYCPGARPGCVTFSYVYQGSGSRAFVR